MNNKILSKVFIWMFAGLLLTFLTGFYLAQNTFALDKIFTKGSIIIFIIIEFALVIFLSARINKMSPTTAKICFLIYSFVSGITFASVFVSNRIESVIFVFLITAIVFAIFALLGATTKIDLSKLGTYLFMALIAALICIVINIFMNNSTFDLLISIVMILIFVGFTAYDVQKIIKTSSLNMIPEDNLAIYGALTLYLDFINLFLNLLSLIGGSRRN
jgi:FtsH-binding integral membrane protein